MDKAGECRVFKRQKSSCLIILDNATSRAVADVSQPNVGSFTAFKLSNLLLLFLPANCTSVIQPLDQGIIAAFKACYKSSWHDTWYHSLM